MPDIKIRVGGSGGTEYTLPSLTAIGGPVPAFSVSHSKQSERKEMQDGSRRWNIKPKKRTWPLAWGYLTAAQLATLDTLNDVEATVEIQDGWSGSATWIECFISGFTVIPLTYLYGAVEGILSYAATMTIEEV
jgi:hypothetical protein